MAKKKQVKKAPKKSVKRPAKKSVKKLSKKAAVKSTRMTLLNFKIPREAKRDIVSNAKKYTGGNISAWVRYSTTKARPSAKDAALLRKSA